MAAAKYQLRLAKTLWLARLAREGKWLAYWEAVDAEKAKGSSRKSPHQIRKEFGYTKMKEELDRHEAWLLSAAPHRRKLAMAETQRNKGRSGLSKAFDELPDSAPYEQEVAWVRAHPLVFTALDKLNREEDYKAAKLSVRDLLSRSNGPAPSKGAATQLRFALADPMGWHKRLMDGGKKKAAEGGGKTGESDADAGIVPDDLDEIAKMLRAVQG